MVILNNLEDGHLVHELLAPAPLHRLDSHVLDGLLLPALVDDAVLAAADLFINVIIVHLNFKLKIYLCIINYQNIRKCEIRSKEPVNPIVCYRYLILSELLIIIYS